MIDAIFSAGIGLIAIFGGVMLFNSMQPQTEYEWVKECAKHKSVDLCVETAEELGL